MQSIARMAMRSVSFRRQSSQRESLTGRSDATTRKAFKYAEKRQWDKLRTLLDQIEEDYETARPKQEEETSTKSLDTTVHIVESELNDEEDPTTPPSAPQEEERRRRRQQELLRRQRSDGSDLLLSDLVDDETGRTLLHVLVSNRPPLDLVERVHSLRPDMIYMISASDSSTSDSSAAGRRGHSPLHSSIIHGAPHDVVRYLLECRPEMAFLRDSEGKVPLVLACEEMGRITGVAPAASSSSPSSGGADPSSSSTAAGARIFPALDSECSELRVQILQAEELIKGLALACPPSVLIEDDRGLTALEHAIFSESPKTTVRKLQHVTIEMMRKMDAVKLIRKMEDDDLRQMAKHGGSKSSEQKSAATILPSSGEVDLKLSLVPATA